MPNAKKKKGKGNKAERAAKLSLRAERNLPIESLPSFPVPETPQQEMKRILSYKHISTGPCGKYEQVPVSITPKENGKFSVQMFTNDRKRVEKNIELVDFSRQFELGFNFLPDYDRNAATYPVAREIMNRVNHDVDVSRRAKKRIDGVPHNIRDAYLKFLERGENIHIKCGTKSRGLPEGQLPSSAKYWCEVKLVGDEYIDHTFVLFAGEEGHFMKLSDSLRTKCLQKYQIELALLLTRECLTRICAGTAEVDDDASSVAIIAALSKALSSMLTEHKRWSDLASLHSFCLDRQIRNKSSVTITSATECSLGEALEACGFHEKAALVYAEAGKYLHAVGHPKPGTVLSNAGLAWKRHGDYEKAESYYCLALQSMQRFLYDPADYRSTVFNTLECLFFLYYDPVKNVAPIRLIMTFRELLLAAGHIIPDDICIGTCGDGTPTLREAYQNATPEQALRIIQSIIVKSTSVQAMRAAILACANRGCRYIDYSYSSSTGERRDRYTKDSARAYLQGVNNVTSNSGYIASCSACGVVKEEKSFAICKCMNAYYCDVSCQKDHWAEHMAECKATRRAAKKRSSKGNEKKSEIGDLGVGDIGISTQSCSWSSTIEGQEEE